jgi:hypothetical protein
MVQPEIFCVENISEKMQLLGGGGDLEERGSHVKSVFSFQFDGDNQAPLELDMLNFVDICNKHSHRFCMKQLYAWL